MLNEALGDLNVTEKEKLKKIKEFLEKKKVAAQQECQLQEGESESREKVRKNPGGRTNNINRGNQNPRQSGTQGQSNQTRHNCYEDQFCEVKWHGLGCQELYKIPKVDDRNAFLKAKGQCIRCGSSYRSRTQPGGGQNKHRCEWRGWKEKARCVENNCSWGAAMCQTHKPDNLSPELKAWLDRAKIRYTANQVQRPLTNANGDDPLPASTTENHEMPNTSMTPSLQMDQVNSTRGLTPWRDVGYDREKL